MVEDVELNRIKCSSLLSEEGLNLLKPVLERVQYSKGHLLISSKRRENFAYIVLKGFVRSYIERDGTDVSYWFAKEGDIVNSNYGYMFNDFGYENIELLEDSTFYKIDLFKLRALLKVHLEIANWVRTITELEAVKSEERYLSYLFTPAEERYLALIDKDPELLQRAPLKDIASYLGISAVSLSRIRARLKRK